MILNGWSKHLISFQWSKIVVARSFSAGNDFNYHDIKVKFRWDSPEKFNFAQDVIDKFAEDDALGGKVAFHHVSDLRSQRETIWNYSDLSDNSKIMASALAKLGHVSKAIAILPKIPEWWLMNVAALRLGTILIPGTTLLSAGDIAKRLMESQADCIIGDVSVAEKLLEVDQKYPDLKKKILVAKDGDDAGDLDYFKSKDWILLSELLNANGKEMAKFRDTNSSEVIQIFFTSGTTGRPKMVPHTQLSYGYCHFVTGKYWLDLTPEDLHWTVSDTGWAKAAWSNVFAPWSQGAGIFVHGMDRFVAKDVLSVLTNRPITTFCAPPTLYRSMVQEDLNKYSFSKLRHCLSAGEPLNQEVISSWKDSTGILIHEGYGQTETTLVAGTFKGMEVRPGSLGKAAPGYDVRIVDNKGEEVPRHTQGNIGIKLRPERPPGLFQNYMNHNQNPGVCFINNFYLTGDRATMDKDDYIWFEARDDDVIISAGYRIGPFEVESALLEHPAVAESAVVASPDAKRGQVVKAFIVLGDAFANKVQEVNFAAQLTEELQSFVKKKTAPYKYPRKITYVRNLPKTVSGKIKRVELRQREFQSK